MKKIIIIILLIFCISLIACKKEDNIETINKSIDNLETIDDDSKRMMEILKIKKEIEKISVAKQSKIKTDILKNEEDKTSSVLKESIKWKNFFNKETSYYFVDEIIPSSNTKTYRVIGNGLRELTAYEYRVDDELFNTNLLSLIDVPFARINEETDENAILSIIRESTDGNETRSPFYLNNFISDKILLEIVIHPTGYIVIRFYTRSTDSFINDKVAYISFVKIDYSDSYNLLKKENLENYQLENKYENVVDFFTRDYQSHHTIFSLNVLFSSHSSNLVILSDTNSINQFLSFFDLNNELFGKELYYYNAYTSACISIGFDVELNNGKKERWLCWVSNEGIVYIKEYSDFYVYYTKKECANYLNLRACIESYNE